MRHRFLYLLSVLPCSQNPVVGAVARGMHEATWASSDLGPCVRDKDLTFGWKSLFLGLPKGRCEGCRRWSNPPRLEQVERLENQTVFKFPDLAERMATGKHELLGLAIPRSGVGAGDQGRARGQARKVR